MLEHKKTLIATIIDILIVTVVIVNIIFFIVDIILLRYNLDNSIHDVQIPGKRRLPKWSERGFPLSNVWQ